MAAKIRKCLIFTDMHSVLRNHTLRWSKKRKRSDVSGVDQNGRIFHDRETEDLSILVCWQPVFSLRVITAKNTLNWNEQSKQKWYSDGLQNEIIGFEMELSKYGRLSVLSRSDSIKTEMDYIVLKWFRRRCWNDTDYFKSVYSIENPSINEMWNDQVWPQMV